MKKLLIGLMLLFSSLANADDFVKYEVYVVNGTGGVTTFNNVPCDSPKIPPGYRAWEAVAEDITNPADIKYLHGCWVWASESIEKAGSVGIIVYWEDGHVGLFDDPNIFTNVRPNPLNAF